MNRPCFAVGVFVVLGCGAAAPPPTAATTASSPSSPSASQASAASPPPPEVPSAPPAPTGGAVLVGDIPALKQFDPKAAVEAAKPALLDCYNQVRANRPDLSGHVKLRVVVNQAGNAVTTEAEPGGSANDPALVACLREALKGVAFGKPGGMATVVVPLAFRR